MNNRVEETACKVMSSHIIFTLRLPLPSSNTHINLKTMLNSSLANLKINISIFHTVHYNVIKYNKIQLYCTIYDILIKNIYIYFDKIIQNFNMIHLSL